MMLATLSTNFALAGWLLVAVAALLASAICSGAEIGIFAVSRIRLRLRTHRRDPAALMLNQWLGRPTRALEGLLVLQNITGFVFSAAITNSLALLGFGDQAQVLLSTLIVTPLVLVFADVAPKDLFNTYADRWMYRLVGIFRWVFRGLTVIPLLPLIHVLSVGSTWLFRRGRREELLGPRGEILRLFQESSATGVISSAQQDIVQRALRLARIKVRDVMIPWTRVIGVPARMSRDGFRALVRRYPVSRVPVLGRSTTEVLGIVEVLDVLAAPNNAAAPGQPALAPVTEFIRPHMTLIGEQDVRSAITLMQRARQTVAIVIDRQGRASGLVTLKDLIEELVGDLENW